MSGSLAHDFLDLVRQEDYYGSAAEPVLSACAERNDSFSSRWSCFSKAVENAVATRELIGLDNIADGCVAGISDAAVSKKLEQAQSQMRRDRFGDRFWGMAIMYHPFRGCPVEDDSLAPEDIEESARAAPAASEPTADFCSAHRDVEEIVRRSSIDDLRAIWSEMTALEDPDASELARATGLGENSAATILDVGEDDKIRTALLLASFLESYHPGLLQEALREEQGLIDHPAAEFGNAIAMGMVGALLDGVRKGFEADCPPE